MIGISRQAYYKRMAIAQRDGQLYNSLEEIVRRNRKVKSRAGLRAIFHKEGLSSLLGLNRFEKQMSIRGYALKPYKSFIKTTDSRGHHHKYDNLIEGKEIKGANQVIVGDITYYHTRSGLFYIFAFTDIYTLEIKGIVGNSNMQGVNAEQCLRQVIKYNNSREYNWELMLHTDGGGQYRSDAFQLMLQKMKMLPSHSKNCLENGLAERINGIIKNEYLHDYDIKNVRQLNQILKNIQYMHNEVWPSAKLGWQTPQQYAQCMKRLPIEKRPVVKIKNVKTNGF